MLAHLSSFSLLIALFFCAAGMLSRYTRAATATVFIILTCCFAALIYSFAVSDFSLKLVFENSHTLKPMVYKISGTWGNHEGSVLMLTWMTALYGFIYAFRKPNLNALRVQLMLVALFVAYTRFTSNPFVSLPLPMPDGIGLNPLLQDIGLALHPPLLYLGYVGFSLVFSISIAHLLEGTVNNSYAKAAKSWCLSAWGLLTIGITLGSWWAYRELGWGGFWFWDPVENASLMPWLCAMALMHTFLVAEKKSYLKKWCVLLSILTYALCLVGFFLVRSGVLASVHSFASDPARGIFMLGILCVVCLLGFGAYAYKATRIESEESYPLLSRETGILLGNLVLLVLVATIFLGTLYPLLLDVLDLPKISVGAPYFESTFIPIAAILLGIAAIFTRAKWKDNDFKKLSRQLAVPFAASVICACVAQNWQLFMVCFLFFTTAWHAWDKKKLFKPMLLSHLGIGLMALGIFLLATGRETYEGVVKEGGKVSVAGYDITLRTIQTGLGPNYVYRRGNFELWQGNKMLASLTPETRVFPVEESTTTEAALYSYYLSDIYLVIGEPSKQGGWAVRAYYKPFMNLVWLGALVAAAGGFLGSFRRKK